MDRVQADRLFSQALDLDRGERGRFLAGVRDPRLRQRVEELLNAAEATDRLLVSGGAAGDGLAASAATLLRGPISPPEAPRPAPPQRRFGPYRAIREIGRGGMGVVYRAARNDGQYEQEVALKVMRRGADAGAVERFTRERQILATLQHPNIARLLDGGVTELGEPYLVMELVDGVPIDLYCDQRSLTLRRRLELLTIVCRAVQAAHRQLVVHRDLKPSNILVNAEGEVKLLDFGIAKLLTPRIEPIWGTPGSQAVAVLPITAPPVTAPSVTAPSVTVTAARSMTPQYASPEQFLGRSITVASDIYQLGLLIYELVAGARPYVLSGAGPRGAERMICEQMPAAPSSAAPERRRELAGDLDAIVLKALCKKSENRYESADRLREDIERHLERQPILARPATLAYRLEKFVGRHTLALTCAAAVALLITGLSITFTLRLVHERDQTRLEASRANAALAESDRVVEFLEDLFDAPSPGTARRTEITVRELLEHGAESLEHQLVDASASRYRLLTALGRIQHKLGLFEQAENHFRKALKLGGAGAGSERERAKTLYELGMTLGQRGQYAEAELLFERSLELLRQNFDADPSAVALALNQLANVRQNRGDLKAALELHRRALLILETHLGHEHSMTAQVLLNMTNTLVGLGYYNEAKVLLRRSLADSKRLLGEDHPQVGQVINNLTIIHARLGEYEASLPLLQQALATMERAFGADHVEVGRVVCNLGICLRSLKRLDEAEVHLQRALNIFGQSLGEDHPSYGQALGNLATLSLNRGNHEQAERLYRRALAIVSAALGADHSLAAIYYNNLGEVEAARGRAREAEALMRRSLRVFETQLGPEHLLLSWPVLQLAQLYHGGGDLERAEPLYLRAVNLRKALVAASPDRIEAMTAYATFLRELGRESEAEMLEET